MQCLEVATRRYHALRLPLLSARKKSNNNAPFQVDFLKSGVADLFWKSKAKRRLIRRASRAAECASHGRGDPDGRKRLLRRGDNAARTIGRYRRVS
jgi:hypothetical protein